MSNNLYLPARSNKTLVVVFASVWFFAGALFLFPGAVGAASLYFDPAQGTFAASGNFTVSVAVNTENGTINAAEGTVNFPVDLMEVLSVSRASSIFSIWVEEPNYSNTSGTISFNGGIPSSGFAGAAGNIFSITFRAKKAGEGAITLSSAAVYANDGKGTNVLTNSRAASVILKSTVAPVFEQPEPAQNLNTSNAPAPVITSPTDPDQGKWYSNGSGELDWTLPAGTVGTRLLLNNSADSTPTVYYYPAIGTKEFQDFSDGVWYFHAQLSNADGWGKVAHFKIQIDQTPPKPFNIEVKEGKETTNTTPSLSFGAVDKTSGIDYYELAFDQQNSVQIKQDTFTLPVLDFGKHTIIVKAFDKAGNFATATQEINIIPLESPRITEYTKTAQPGENIFVKGIASPNVSVKVHIERSSADAMANAEISKEVKSGPDGIWFLADNASKNKGTYNIWAEVTNSSGGKSRPSERVFLIVSPPAFITIGKTIIDYLTIIIILLLLIAILAAAIFYIWRRVLAWRRKIGKETADIGRTMNTNFRTLKQTAKEQIEYLDGKPGLTRNEKIAYDKLKEALDLSAKNLDKGLKNIEEDLK